MRATEKLRTALSNFELKPNDDLLQICNDALDAGLFEELEFWLSRLVSGPQKANFRTWQMLGLARRELQDSGGAFHAFEQARKLAPQDAQIAHSLARTAMEAGFKSAHLFKAARALAPNDSQVLLGNIAALLADEGATAALDELAGLLQLHPGWHEGHRTYARIAAMAGPASDRLASLKGALSRYPHDLNLWVRMVEIAMQGGDYTTALSCIERARQISGGASEFDRAEAICQSEMGAAQVAEGIFDRLPTERTAVGHTHRIRNLIRLGRLDEAAQAADRKFSQDEEVHLWPYRALLWRALGDPRWDWLEGDSRLVGVYDISSELGSIGDLVDVLRAIHRGTGAPIDQSVRGGTQTDGDLLARAEPEIRRLRAALVEAARSHVAQLPPPQHGHPTLIRSRSPIRVEGSWSVRLVSAGFHVDHVHPLGWFSSAFYAHLPESHLGISRNSTGDAGWLVFGESPLLPDLKAFRSVEPQVGRLALFPSTMWHGTRPFDEGERLTVAFDITRPRP